MFVSSVYTQAATWEWTERNPVAAFMARQKAKSGLKRKVKRQRVLSHDEETRLEKAAEAYLAQPGQASQRHERLMAVAAVFVSLDQGVRLGELTAMLHTHVDRAKGAHGELFIPQCDGPDESGPVKSEPRSIPLFARARRYIDMLPKHAEAPWVLWHGRGQQYSQLRQAFGKMLAKAKIAGLTWHDLRRTCGCRLLQDKRWPMDRVSQFLGHKDIKVTREHYAWLEVEHLHSELQRSSGHRV
jgi:integrase